MMIITSDHGHLISNKVSIKNKEILKYMENPQLFIENRSPAFLVKKGEEDNFKKAFNKDFGRDFHLFSKDEILNLKIFGEYKENSKHELFESSIGDYMAIPKYFSNKCLIKEENYNIVSFHGGNSDDEIYVPLIVISN